MARASLGSLYLQLFDIDPFCSVACTESGRGNLQIHHRLLIFPGDVEGKYAGPAFALVALLGLIPGESRTLVLSLLLGIRSVDDFVDV